MKNFIKFAAVGLAGYFIGFYEMKYHVLKCIAMNDIHKNNSDQENEIEKD